MKFSSSAAARLVTIAILAGSAFGSSAESTQHLRSVSVASEDVVSVPHDATAILDDPAGARVLKKKAKGATSTTSAKTPKVPKSTKMPKVPKSEIKVPKSAKGLATTSQPSAAPSEGKVTSQPSAATSQPSAAPSPPPTDQCQGAVTEFCAAYAGVLVPDCAGAVFNSACCAGNADNGPICAEAFKIWP